MEQIQIGKTGGSYPPRYSEFALDD